VPSQVWCLLGVWHWQWIIINTSEKNMDFKAMELAARQRLQQFIDQAFAELKQQVNAKFAQARIKK